MDLAILPLAITMLAGPGLIADFIFATNQRPIQASAFFTVGFALAVTVGVFAAATLAGALGEQLNSDPNTSTSPTTLQLILVALLILLSLRSYKNREKIQPPKWLGKLQEAKPSRAFTVAFLLVFLMPIDLLIMFTVGLHLEGKDLPFTAALPFLGLTTLLAGLPLLALLVLGKRANSAVAVFRAWMNDNTWLVNIIVYLIFVFIILG